MAIAVVAGIMPASAVSTKTAKATSAPNASKQNLPKSLFADFLPPAPFWIVVKQPNGTTFKARLTPAEVGGNLETEDGYTVTKADDGWWYYAKSARVDVLKASKLRAGIDAPRGLRQHVGRHASIFSGEAGLLRAQTLRHIQLAAHEAQMQAVAAGELPYRFKTPFLMLATWYDEEKGQTTPQFQEGHDVEFFSKMLNGFGGNPTGTMTEFWLENSYGQFLVEVDVLGPYTSVRSIGNPCYYGNVERESLEVNGENIIIPGLNAPAPRVDDLDPVGNFLGIGGLGAAGMAMEAVPQADPLVDFGKYDNDNDGKVDFVGVIHSGADMAATGDPCHTWSHAIEVTFAGATANALVPGAGDAIVEYGGIPTTDVNAEGVPVVVDRTFTMPEIGAEIGVATHEMMHARGEPDYYNTAYISTGTGDWDIMAGGSWFGNPPGSNPLWSNPATRVFQGWVKPTVVHGDVRNVALKPREVMPKAGYTVDDANPNLLLIPTAWSDSTEPADVYGLAKDPANGKYVTEGWYVEYLSRSVNRPGIHEGMKRMPMFDRVALNSGVMIWHFDYWKKSNVYYGANNGQNDPDRSQMDIEEFDFGDDTQEMQLNYTRGEPSDPWFNAATGMTSATRKLPPGVTIPPGSPQAAITGSGTLVPFGEQDYPFTVKSNPANMQMNVSLVGDGDCVLNLYREGKAERVGIDSAGAGAAETTSIRNPKAGNWTLKVSDFAACGNHEWEVSFVKPVITSGAADTYTNQEKPSGWAITNIGPHLTDELDINVDAPGPEVVTLDILNLDKTEVDVSPGFVGGASTSTYGSAPINAGRSAKLTVPVFNNGGKAVSGVNVSVRVGSASGPEIASQTVSLPGYGRRDVSFSWTPDGEGKYDLYTVVDGANSVREEHEGNNVQKSDVVVGPANPAVLVVDDEGSNDFHESYLGALTAAGVPWAYAKGHVDAAMMRQYKAVVWEAGLDRYQGQLNALDRREIKKYLDGGGKLWISSIRMAAAMGEAPGRTNPGSDESMPAMLRDYFGAIFKDTLQIGGGTLTGVGDASGIGGRASFKHDIAPGRPLQDWWEIAAGDNASKVGTAYKVLDWSQGGQQGVRVVGDAKHNRFKSVYFGFNLTQLLDGDDQVTLTKQVMTYFGVPTGTYTPAKPFLFHSSPRSRKSGEEMSTVVFSFGATPVVKYRAHGRGGWHTMALKPGSTPGVYEGVLAGKWFTPLGVDYWIQGGPSDPAGGPNLAHYIGVSPPAFEPPPAAPTRVLGARRGGTLPSTGVGDGVFGALLIALALALALRARRRTA